MNINRRRGTRKTGTDSETALDAVAFQDDLTRRLALTSQVYPRRPALSRPRNTPKKNVRPVVDTGRGGKPVSNMVMNNFEDEYVVGPKPIAQTLAQRRGLVAAPDPHLSEHEWQTVKNQSNCRDDSKHPCAICQEDFGMQKQVLLSCTHVFHQTCLAAFERFSGKKTCPMCRKQSYETRMIHEGARHHLHVCATRIQAAWRGHIVYAWYRRLRKTLPPKDPVLRKKFYEQKLAAITDRMVKSLDCGINSLFIDVDRNLQRSRDIFRQFDRTHKMITDEDWEGIQLKAVVRGELDCAICLTSLETMDSDSTSCSAEHEISKSSLQQASICRKNRILLSCSHVFHNTCLSAFEEFTIDKTNFVCPVCRTAYQKKVI